MGVQGKAERERFVNELTRVVDASLREAADKMIENHHHRLIVVDKNQPEAMPLGIISSFDIVAEMARSDSVWQT